MRHRDICRNFGLTPFNSTFDNWISSFFRDDFERLPQYREGFKPIAVDMVEKEDRYLLFLNLPGVEKNDVKISQFKGVLNIKATKTQERVDERESYHYKERFAGEMQRNIRLPQDADADSIEAKMEKGVLTLTLLKSKKQPQKEIKIK